MDPFSSDTQITVELRSLDRDDPDVSPDCPDPMFADAMLGTLEAIMYSADQGEWDQPPVIGPVYLRGRSPLDGGSAASMLLQFNPWWQVTLDAVAAGRPYLPDALTVVAEATQRLPRGEAPSLSEDMVALAFISEMWRLPPSDDPEEERRREALRRQGEMCKHPARQEAREVSAVDVHGVRYWIRSVRGETGMAHRVGPWPFDGASAAHDGLEYFLQTFEGRTLPPFSEWAVSQRGAGR